jgi:arsenate reductase (thioredoxin)
MSTEVRTQSTLVLRGIVSRLEGELGEHFTRDTIEHYVRDSYDELAGRSKVLTHIPAFVDRYAKQRLRALAKHRGLVVDHPPVVLFVCERNDAASQMAAALFAEVAGDRATTWSAGTAPAEELRAGAVEVMHEIGVELLDAFPKPLAPEVEQAADVIVTIDPHDLVDVVEGTAYRAWKIPAVEPDLAGLRSLRDELRARVEALVAELAPSSPTRSRATFLEELEQLSVTIRQMCDDSVALLERAAVPLRGEVPEAIEEIDRGDDRIDEQWLGLERRVVEVIARQQPVATDLRRLIAMLQAGLHLERIGDGAVMLAHALATPTALPDRVRAHLGTMVELVCTMTVDASSALLDRDEAAARRLEALDEDLDELHHRTLQELVLANGGGSQERALALHADRASRALERAGGHAVDVAEAALFLTTGKFRELGRR